MKKHPFSTQNVSLKHRIVQNWKCIFISPGMTAPLHWIFDWIKKISTTLFPFLYLYLFKLNSLVNPFFDLSKSSLNPSLINIWKYFIRKEEEKTLHYYLCNIFINSFSLLSINQLVFKKERREQDWDSFIVRNI